jgi:hypothetical protein
VDFNVSPIALGGSGTALLGGVGGSGPGSTAQASWWKVKLAGTTYFIPLWPV